MGANLRLDVLIPTHNRAPLLERCVRSVLNARVPPGLDLHVTVICNACSDDSTTSVRRLQAAFPRRVSLVEERRRGKSRALNAGVAATVKAAITGTTRIRAIKQGTMSDIPNRRNNAAVFPNELILIRVHSLHRKPDEDGRSC